jgi:hypothetical protein
MPVAETVDAIGIHMDGLNITTVDGAIADYSRMKRVLPETILSIVRHPIRLLRWRRWPPI